MRPLTKTVGVLALLCIGFGVNFLVIQKVLFSGPVLVSLGVGLAAGLLWVVLQLAQLAGAKTESSAAALKTILASVFVLGICIVVYLFVRRADYSVDLTQEGRRELAPQTIQVLQSLTTPVEVTSFFIRSADDRTATAQDKTRRFLEQCAQYTDQLQIEFIDPQARPERVQALEVLGLQKSTVGTVLMQSGPRRRELPLSDIHARLEERDFTNALINVAQETAPVIYFLAGHGGHDIRDGKTNEGGMQLLGWLQREGYAFNELLIDPDSPRMPDDCAVLFINGYTDDLTPAELQAFDLYVENGGRIMVAASLIYFENGIAGREYFRPWLRSRFGIDLRSDFVLRYAKDASEIMFHTDFSLLGYPDFEDTRKDFRGSYNAQHPITRTLDKKLQWNIVHSVILDESLPTGTVGWDLLRTSPNTWAETDVAGTLNGVTPQPDPDEYRGPIAVAVAAAHTSEIVDASTQPAESRIVVFGNDFMTQNQSMLLAANHDLILNGMAWLTEQEDMIAIRPAGSEQEPLIMTDLEMRTTVWTSSLATVQFIVVLGIIAAWFRRRRS